MVDINTPRSGYSDLSVPQITLNTYLICIYFLINNSQTPRQQPHAWSEDWLTILPTNNFKISIAWSDSFKKQGFLAAVYARSISLKGPHTNRRSNKLFNAYTLVIMTTPTHSKKTEQEEATHKQGVKDPKTASPATQRPHTTQHGGPTSGAKVAVAKAGKPQSELAKNKPAVARPVQEGQKKPQVTAAKSVPAKEDLAKKKPVFARLLKDEKQRESGEILQKTAQISRADKKPRIRKDYELPKISR
jgi:hypothetical protein